MIVRLLLSLDGGEGRAYAPRQLTGPGDLRDLLCRHVRPVPILLQHAKSVLSR
jgi:hypothetical protein